MTTAFQETDLPRDTRSTVSRADEASWYEAMTLEERAASLTDARAKRAGFDLAAGAVRIKRWRAATPFLSDAEFHERLRAVGIDETELVELLGESSAALRARQGAVPAWLVHLEQAWAAADEPAPGLFASSAPDGAAYPLLVAIEPMVTWAQRELASRARTLQDENGAPFDLDGTLASLFAHMPAELFGMVGRVLALELHIARLGGALEGEDGRARFDSFVAQLRDRERSWALWVEYPVLARLLVTRLCSWVEMSAELLERIAQDTRLIAETFNDGQPVGAVVKITAGLGDSHREGRSVTLVDFASGRKVVYKPRPLAVEAHFQDLLAWVNGRGWTTPFRVLKILDRGDYGWVEFVEQRPCNSREEVANFYRRQGGLLALLHVLHGTDFHFQNVIACGDQPVLVDLESLFTPDLPLGDGEWTDPAAWAALERSVTRVGLLPARSWGDETQAGVDISGLGNPEGALGVRPAPFLEHPGTDEMRWTRKRVPWQRGQNMPRLAGRDVGVLAFREDIVGGFRGVYDLVARTRLELSNGPIAAFATDEIRVITLPTFVYRAMVLESVHPDVVRRGVDRDRFFDRLLAHRDRYPYLPRIERAARRALERGDVPLFTTTVDGRHLAGDGKDAIRDVFERSGMDLVRARLAGMNDDERETQVWLIHASLATLTLGEHESPTTLLPARDTPPTSHVSRADVVARASRIADRIARLAITTPRGMASWLGVSMTARGVWTLGPVGLDLHGGLAGLAMALAYAGARLQREDLTDLARGAVSNILSQLDRGTSRAPSLGAFTGWSGIAYALAHVGILWRRDDLVARAQRMLVDLATGLDRDTEFDVIGGAAGYALVVAGLKHLLAGSVARDLLRACGQHLAAHARPQPRGLAWLSAVSPVPLSGFAHGSAGISSSLFEIADVTGEDRFARLASEGIEHERGLFDAGVANWRDLRSGTRGGGPGEPLQGLVVPRGSGDRPRACTGARARRRGGTARNRARVAYHV